MIDPRKYQTEAVDAISAAFKKGLTRQLISLPTGTGKTIVFGLLIKRWLHAYPDARVLVLAHREELLKQAQDKIGLIAPDVETGILKGTQEDGLEATVCIASVQTATNEKRLALLKKRGISLMVIDEAHHATATSYYRVASELGFIGTKAEAASDEARDLSEALGEGEGWEESPRKLLVGVTATAYRGDKTRLGEVFEKIVFSRSITTMISGGFLCDAKGISVQTKTDLSDINTVAGDFNRQQLGLACDTEGRNAIVAESYIQHANGRSAVVFCVDVQHSKNMAEMFRTMGVEAREVHGGMGADERAEVLERYESGALPVVTNCNVLTEGWDAPRTSAVLLARPTKSPVLYAQMVGRGLRLYPTKEDCLVLDFADVAGKHDLCDLGTLAGIAPAEKEKFKPRPKESLMQLVERVAREKFEADALAEAALTADSRNVDLFKRTRFLWGPVGRDFRLMLDDGGAVWCRLSGAGFTAWAVNADGNVKVLSSDVLPLEYAMGICEDYARGMNAVRFADKGAKWRERPATETQKALLQKLGLAYPLDISQGEASRVLNERLNAPATPGQIQYINRYQLHPAPELLTKIKAGKLIAADKARRNA